MKKWTDDEKRAGPMFPRLHVKDTEKGGPRAPPRNKMALYEQLSIPSQRFNMGRMPLSSNSARNSIPLAPSSQEVVQRPEASFYRATRIVHVCMQESGHERSEYSPIRLPPSKPTQVEKTQTFHNNVINSISLLALLEQSKDVGDVGDEEDEFSVPIFVHSEMGQSKRKNQSRIEGGKFTLLSSNLIGPSTKHPVSSVTGRELKSKNEINPKRFMSNERLSAISSNNILTRERIDESMKQSNTCVDREKSNPAPNFRLVDDNNGPNNDVCKEYVREAVMIADRSDDNSETSMVDSMPALDIFPDDVVGLIGQKHFWKARRAIVNQQRVFGVQVFELHRLVKVQRLMAESPHFLIEDSSYLLKSSTKISPVKKLSADCALAPQNHFLKQKPDHVKSNDGAVDIASEKTCAPSVDHQNQPPPCYNPYASHPPPPPPPVGADTNMSPWPYHHPQPCGHQWLIPVMSPSEGLIYKPYPGSGFMAPTPPQGPGFLPMAPPMGYGYFPPYGMQVMSLNMSSSSVDQMNQMSQFHGPSPTNGQPLSDRGANFSSHHQSSCNLTPTRTNHTHSQVAEIPAPKNGNAQRSTASSPSKKREQGRRENSEISGGRNPLPLFPATPPIVVQDGKSRSRDIERATQVIRVVPHNARSATESAARIFQSIQDERKQFDSV